MSNQPVVKQAVRKGQTFEYVFPSSGETVRYRRVPSSLSWDIRQAMNRSDKAPKPPKQEVTLFDESKVVEENKADPEYVTARREWDGKVGEAVYHAVIKRGVLEWDKEAVAALRLEYAGEAIDPTAGLDDRVVFVYHIAGVDFDDITGLVQAIHNQSAPTEVSVQAAMDSFPRAGGDEADHGGSAAGQQ